MLLLENVHGIYSVSSLVSQANMIMSDHVLNYHLRITKAQQDFHCDICSRRWVWEFLWVTDVLNKLILIKTFWKIFHIKIIQK